MSSGRRLWALFGPYRGRLAAATLLLFLGSTLQGLPILLIQHVFNDVLLPREAGAAPADEGLLVGLALATVGLYALNGVVTVGRAMLTRSVAWRVVTDLRDRLYEHMLRQELGWHQHTPSGERVNRLLGDVNNLQFAVSGVVTAVQKPVTLVVLAGTAVWMNPTLAALALAALPLVAWPIHRFGRWVRAATAEAMEASAKLGARAQEALAGIRVVQVFGAEAASARAFSALNRAHEAAQVRALTAQLLPPPTTELLASVGVGLVIWVGGRDVLAGEMAPGDLVAFLVALAVMNQPLKGLSEVGALMQRSLAAADRVFALLDRAPQLADTGTREAGPPALLRFEGVVVDYGEGPVLHGIDLEVKAGQRVALVGASGGGKTTLLGLVPRLLDPSAGRVTWDGVPLPELSLVSLRRQVAMVTQETFLFDDTVAANLRFGRPEASDAEVEAAARAANAHGFIEALPLGYQTRIDEAGMRLSGGQRQRLCIARALLRGAPVLLLDEATSNLDGESERLVQEALDHLMVGRTTLVVAHRLATVRDADLIVVLAEGRVVEQGRHEELLARDGEYRRLWGRQG